MTTSDQATAEQATFVMEHFRVFEPGRLEVEGRWDGVHGVDLDESALVLHVEGRVDRVDAESVQRTPHTWRARFAWDGTPTAIDGAFLEVGGRLVVEIGARPSTRRRLGRPTRPARPMPAESTASASEHAEGDIVSVHAALAAAQDRLAEAQDETELAHEAARRAREDADRERSRRQSETTRHRAALDNLKEVADEALRAERARRQQLERAVADAEARARRLEAARELEQPAEGVDEAGRLRQAVIELEASLDEARRAGADAAGEAGRLRDRLASVRAALEGGG